MDLCVFIPSPRYVRTVLELIPLSFAVALVVWFVRSRPVTSIHTHAAVVRQVLCTEVAVAGQIVPTSDVDQVGYSLPLSEAKIMVTERLWHICKCNL